jgi:hypothetical protein
MHNKWVVNKEEMDIMWKNEDTRPKGDFRVPRPVSEDNIVKSRHSVLQKRHF